MNKLIILSFWLVFAIFLNIGSCLPMNQEEQDSSESSSDSLDSTFQPLSDMPFPYLRDTTSEDMSTWSSSQDSLSDVLMESVEEELRRLDNEYQLKKMNKLLRKRINQLQKEYPDGDIKVKIHIIINGKNYNDTSIKKYNKD